MGTIRTYICHGPGSLMCIKFYIHIYNINRNSTKQKAKIYQEWMQNLSPRPSWRALGGSWGPLGGLLGLSWPILALKANINPKSGFTTPLDPPILGPQINQINEQTDKPKPHEAARRLGESSIQRVERPSS